MVGRDHLRGHLMNLTIVMPVEGVNRIIQALGKLPYDESAPVIQAIMQQANQQIAEAQAAQQGAQQSAQAPAEVEAVAAE